MQSLVSPIVAIRDLKTGVVSAISSCRHVGEVIREFDLLKKDPNTKFGKHPEDYILLKIGTVNDLTGELVAEIPPEQLA